MCCHLQTCRMLRYRTAHVGWRSPRSQSGRSILLSVLESRAWTYRRRFYHTWRLLGRHRGVTHKPWATRRLETTTDSRTKVSRTLNKPLLESPMILHLTHTAFLVMTNEKNSQQKLRNNQCGQLLGRLGLGSKVKLSIIFPYRQRGKQVCRYDTLILFLYKAK